MLISFLVWLIRAFVTGRFLTKEQKDSEVTALKAGHADVITALALAHENTLTAEKRRADEQVANQTVRGDEWKETAVALRAQVEVEQEIARTAVSTNQAVDYLFQSQLQSARPLPAERVENGAQEGETP